MTCWCGVKKPYFAPLPATCGGHGYHECFCGGDLCVCHHHGEADCFGCDDCQVPDDFDDGDFEPHQSDESPLGPEGCLFPGECCMPGFHYESECHTAADIEAMWEEREREKGVAP